MSFLHLGHTLISKPKKMRGDSCFKATCRQVKDTQISLQLSTQAPSCGEQTPASGWALAFSCCILASWQPSTVGPPSLGTHGRKNNFKALLCTLESTFHVYGASRSLDGLITQAIGQIQVLPVWSALNLAPAELQGWRHHLRHGSGAFYRTQHVKFGTLCATGKLGKALLAVLLVRNCFCSPLGPLVSLAGSSQDTKEP